ncbi:hypothetical protein FISHEDRAFT_76544 [Fistulina hepatica ATCC 64428]|uniref:Mid2 domain-containing protein n=1 Tax=Fistulina hepatica ATCC 64428 TaxID=1128425 RepID=A0A0D7A639_9AGAR|nr:hypothetical protein FISHEDRAFT_76544 [Fistulina hepatica ATCC 64428]
MFLQAVLLFLAFYVARSSATLTITRGPSDSSLTLSGSWKNVSSIQCTNDLGLALTTTLPANSSSFEYIGYQRAEGSLYGVCIDCNTTTHESSYLIINGHNSSLTNATQDRNPTVLFSARVDPSTVHNLSIYNIPDSRFKNTSQLTFLSLVMSIDNHNASTSTASASSSPTQTASSTASSPTSTSGTNSSSTSSSKKKSIPPVAIAAIVLSVLLFIVLIVGVVIFFVRRRRRRKNEDPESGSSAGPATSSKPPITTSWIGPPLLIPPTRPESSYLGPVSPRDYPDVYGSGYFETVSLEGEDARDSRYSDPAVPAPAWRNSRYSWDSRPAYSDRGSSIYYRNDYDRHRMSLHYGGYRTASVLPDYGHAYPRDYRHDYRRTSSAYGYF